MRVLLFLAFLLLPFLPAQAEEPTITLRPGPALATVSTHCGGCHSLDYVQMNAPFLSADGWKAEVAKMRAAFGAQFDEEDATAITAYLASNYGAS
jgi:mono/diheme cytochrome c family protein